MTIETLTVILALLLSLFNLWDKIESRYRAAKAPTKLLEGRLEKLENRTKSTTCNSPGTSGGLRSSRRGTA